MIIRVNKNKFLTLPNNNRIHYGCKDYVVPEGQERFFLKAQHRGTVTVLADDNPLVAAQQKVEYIKTNLENYAIDLAAAKSNIEDETKRLELAQEALDQTMIVESELLEKQTQEELARTEQLIKTKKAELEEAETKKKDLAQARKKTPKKDVTNG